MPKYRPLVAVTELGAGMVCADDVREPLLLWKQKIESRGGTMHANSITRTVAEQQPLRDKYEAWLHAGQPASYDPAKMSNVAANQPGKSNHQGGRAIDLSTFNVFPNEPADKQIDLLWETGTPFGWTHIIDQPDEARNERWHYDWWGGWVHVKDYLGYEMGCMCSALDVGQAGPWQSDERLVQALLLRAGFDIGEPDGDPGKRTYAGVVASGFAKNSPVGPYQWDAIASYLRSLPAANSWTRISG